MNIRQHKDGYVHVPMYLCKYYEAIALTNPVQIQQHFQSKNLH